LIRVGSVFSTSKIDSDSISGGTRHGTRDMVSRSRILRKSLSNNGRCRFSAPNLPGHMPN
jgi:hypothetical protein